MKSALVYLLMTRLKAQLKELVRKPARPTSPRARPASPSPP